MDIFDFLTHAWCRVQHANYPATIFCTHQHTQLHTCFINTPIHFNPPGPFLEDCFRKRYLNTPVVINDEGDSILLA